MTMLRIGTRGSRLALWQANFVRDELMARNPGLEVELEIIKTRGDKILDRPLALVGGKGLFVKELEEALLEGRVDLAVHSLKDMPVECPEGLELSAYPQRASLFDALCPLDPTHSLETLPKGAKVGTGSMRRGLQLKAMRSDLEIVNIRGNVPTRLNKRETEGLAAVVLAEAGLRRLGLWEEHFEVLTPPHVLPAPAQGALAIQTRVDDPVVGPIVMAMDDPEVRLTLAAERNCLAAIEGNCHTPFAVWAKRSDDELHLHARLMDEDGRVTEGQRMVILRDTPLEQAAELGLTLGRNLLERHRAAAKA